MHSTQFLAEGLFFSYCYFVILLKNSDGNLVTVLQHQSLWLEVDIF